MVAVLLLHGLREPRLRPPAPGCDEASLRAVLKAADLCAADPAVAAQQVVTKGYTREYDYAFELIKKLPYNVWRTESAENSLRFHALRLHEAGMIKSSPQKILSQGTDWRFLNELKRELKGWRGSRARAEAKR